MSELKILVGQRKILRKKVTDCVTRSSEYVTMDNTAKLSEKSLPVEYCIRNS